MTLLTFVGCKTQSLAGEYKQYSTFISLLALSSDSSFSGGTGFCVGSVNLIGQWTKKKNCLYLTPTVPPHIYFDTSTKRYRYKPDTFIVAKSGDNIKALADLNTNYSPHIFKIKNGKLYLQSKDTSGVINYSSCPFYKIPKDASRIKLKRLQRKNEICCSDLNSIQKLLLQLRLVK